MPAEQPLGREWLGIVAGRIQHHLDDAFDISVGRAQSPGVHSGFCQTHITLWPQLIYANYADIIGVMLRSRSSLGRRKPYLVFSSTKSTSPRHSLWQNPRVVAGDWNNGADGY